MKNLKEIYKNNIIDTKEKIVSVNPFAEEPVFVDNLLSPKTKFEVSAAFNNRFSIDEEGMMDLIDMFESEYKEGSEDFLTILNTVYIAADGYLGGKGDPQKRKAEYKFNTKLSDIKGKNMGQCLERATMGHQLLTLLNMAGVTNYKSILTNSCMYEEGQEKGPHSFITLRNPSEDKIFFYDIENLLDFKDHEGKLIHSVGLYSVTDKEFKEFEAGGIIRPKEAIESPELELVSPKRYFGGNALSKFYKEKEDDDAR